MTIEWLIDNDLIPFNEAETFMKERVHAIQEGTAKECIWLLQHPPLYTAGTSAKKDDLLDPTLLPVHMIGRGGQYTYHGPGQRICYVMIDLNKRGKDLRQFVKNLEEWGIQALFMCGIDAFRSNEGVGLWVRTHSKESIIAQKSIAKIAAIGVRVSKWVTSYGIAFNVSPDLDHYKGIVPCGIRRHGITSLQSLGKDITMDLFDTYLKESFNNHFE